MSFRCFAGGSAAFLVVWGGQMERETPLADFKLHTARFGVRVGLTALVGVLSGVGDKTLFQICVVGADMDRASSPIYSINFRFGHRFFDFSLGQIVPRCRYIKTPAQHDAMRTHETTFSLTY